MTLPDIDRLACLGSSALRGLREALRSSGYDTAFLQSLSRLGERVDDPLRAPIRVWHLRRRAEPAALMARLFTYGDSVPRSAVTPLLADLTPLVEHGLLEQVGEEVRSPWRIAPFFGSWIIGDALDHGGDAVMAAGGLTSILALAATPPRQGATCLDMGCGAGALAVTMAKATKHVTAVDKNPRAVAMTKLNARLNGIEHVDARVGDLFSPLGNEKYDCIVSQPPFVAMPAGTTRATFLHGGTRGDELALRVVAESLEHLTPNGRAYVLCDWPIVEGATPAARMRQALGSRGALALLLAPNKDLDEVAVHYAAAAGPTLDASFRGAVIALRDHYEQAGVRALATGLAVLGATSAWTETVSIRHVHDAPLHRAAVEGWLDVLALAHDEARLARTRLALPAGSTVLEAPVVEGDAGLIIRFSAGSLAPPVVLTGAEAADLRALLDGNRPSPGAAQRLLLKGALVPTG